MGAAVRLTLPNWGVYPLGFSRVLWYPIRVEADPSKGLHNLQFNEVKLLSKMISNLSEVQANYKKMLRSDAARADRAQEAANRRAERAAATQDALDALLATL